MLGLFIIDPATGAMFRLPPKFETKLIQEENKNYIDDNGNEIIIGGYIKNINSLTEEEKKL